MRKTRKRSKLPGLPPPSIEEVQQFIDAAGGRYFVAKKLKTSWTAVHLYYTSGHVPDRRVKQIIKLIPESERGNWSKHRIRPDVFEPGE